MAPRAAPRRYYMVGWPDYRVRAYVKEQDWKASIVARPAIHQNEESFEVRYAGGRKYFYFDDDASRR